MAAAVAHAVSPPAATSHPLRAVQSILAPEFLTISTHLARSALMVARKASTDSLRDAVPIPTSFSRRVGVSWAFRTAALMRSAIASRPLGPTRPYQVTL